MKDLKSFLTNLTNEELATFIAYRIEGFLEGSRKKIIAEVSKRNLSQLELKQLYKKGLSIDDNSKLNCPQCGSDKLFVETDYELKQNSRGNSEIAVETNRCRICGFNPAKSNQKSLINKIKQALGLYEKTRLKRPEIDGRMFTEW